MPFWRRGVEMSFADGLPISESLGVFIGVSGFNLLTDGKAEPLIAAVSALASGAALYLTRRWLRQRRKD